MKTAALNLIHHAEQVGEELDIPSLCASFSQAVSDTLVPRVVKALEEQLGHTIHTSPLTQYVGALGAALFAYKKCNK